MVIEIIEKVSARRGSRYHVESGGCSSTGGLDILGVAAGTESIRIVDEKGRKDADQQVASFHHFY